MPSSWDNLVIGARPSTARARITVSQGADGSGATLRAACFVSCARFIAELLFRSPVICSHQGGDDLAAKKRKTTKKAKKKGKKK
jgi:hypothetical protein